MLLQLLQTSWRDCLQTSGNTPYRYCCCLCCCCDSVTAAAKRILVRIPSESTSRGNPGAAKRSAADMGPGKSRGKRTVHLHVVLWATDKGAQTRAGSGTSCEVGGSQQMNAPEQQRSHETSLRTA